QLVHEADTGGEHGVGGVLGQLGRLPAHDEPGLAVARLDLLPQDRVVDRVHRLNVHRIRLASLGSDDHAVRPQEVTDGGPFLQELRIAHDADISTAFGTKIPAQVPVGSGRNGALDDDDG